MVAESGHRGLRSAHHLSDQERAIYRGGRVGLSAFRRPNQGHQQVALWRYHRDLCADALVSWFRSSQYPDITLGVNFETETTLGFNKLLVSLDSEIRPA